MKGGERRFPRWVYGVGNEPDARFSLANERTYLAWIRTALALIAGGVALDALALPMHPGLRLAAVLVLVALGILSPVLAFTGWMAAERALRLGQPLPSSRTTLPVAIGVALVALLVGIGIVSR